MKTFAKYGKTLDFDQFQESQPVVGILMTDVFSELYRNDTFPWHQFSWTHNMSFVHYGGSWAVPIRHDLEDEDLYAMLDSINGIYFAGGGAPLIDMETGE